MVGGWRPSRSASPAPGLRATSCRTAFPLRRGGAAMRGAAWLLVGLWLAGGGRCDGSLQDSMRELHGRFALRLHRALAAADDRRNMAASPLSASLSLALLQLGAKGNTRAQLEGALGYDANDAQVQRLLLGWRGDLGNASRAGAVWLRHTCTLLVHSSAHLLPPFTQHAAAWAAATIVRDNFSQNHDEPWPPQAGSSSGELSGSGELQGEGLWWGRGLQVALINTVAFRGVWQQQFQSGNTQNLPFVLADGTPLKVPMMHQAAEVRFGEFRAAAAEQRYAVLELAYLGRSLRLQLVLPSDRKTPLSSLEARLTARQLASWDSGLRRTKMDIFLPRFKVQSEFNLRAVLPALGVADAFDPAAADFTGISEDGLYVSDAFHQVRMEVAEDGTKAAAATAMVLLKRSRAPVFKADRPFLFLLRQADTGSILFMGRVMNPAAPTP